VDFFKNIWYKYTRYLLDYDSGSSRQRGDMNITRLFSLLVLSLLLTANIAQAEKYRGIDAKGVKKLLDAGNALVINPLTPIEFDHEHIPGSINIPIEFLAVKLPADRNIPVVFYCIGEKCVYSWRAAEIAADLGYTNVYAFRGGIPEWKAAGYPPTSILKLPDIVVPAITPEKLAKMLAKEDMVLVDINSEADADRFWIDTPKRVYVSLNDFRENYIHLPKDKKIVIVDLRGQRGPMVVRFLMVKGYNNVLYLEGGLERWVFEGHPIKRAK
jgi:rhodanese-related sulfurtransferase